MKRLRGSPEEPVRQALLRHLVEDLGVPVPCVRLELGLVRWDREVRDRVDLAVFSAAAGELDPVLLAECKAPEVPLDEAVVAQLRRYLRVLPARWAVATNGRRILSWKCSEGTWEPAPLPAWERMRD